MNFFLSRKLSIFFQTLEMSSDSLKVGHLEDESLKRKEKLKALKKGELKGLNDSNGTNNSSEQDDLSAFPKPIFRNYTPKDESLKSGVLPKPKLIEIENEIKDHLDNAKPAPLIEKEIDLTTLAPQKIDWDLKRDVEKKLKVLEKRTQKAIVELIRDRIKGEKNTDLAELVSIGSRHNIKRSEVKDSKKKTNDEDEAEEEEDDEEENDYEPSTSSSQFSVSSISLHDDPIEEVPFEPNTKTQISDDEDIY